MHMTESYNVCVPEESLGEEVWSAGILGTINFIRWYQGCKDYHSLSCNTLPWAETHHTGTKLEDVKITNKWKYDEINIDATIGW